MTWKELQKRETHIQTPKLGPSNTRADKHRCLPLCLPTSPSVSVAGLTLPKKIKQAPLCHVQKHNAQPAAGAQCVCQSQGCLPAPRANRQVQAACSSVHKLGCAHKFAGPSELSTATGADRWGLATKTQTKTCRHNTWMQLHAAFQQRGLSTTWAAVLAGRIMRRPGMTTC